MRLSDDELKRIRDALSAAFPNPGQLSNVVSYASIGTTFEDVSFGTSGHREAVHKLLVGAVGQYHLTRLLKAASDAAPDNRELAEVDSFLAQYYSLLPRILPVPLDQSVGVAERVRGSGGRVSASSRSAWLKSG